MITIHCTCGEKYLADEQHIGRTLQCKNCHQILTIGTDHPMVESDEHPPGSQPRSQTVSSSAGSPSHRIDIFLCIVALVLLGIIFLLLRSGKEQSSPVQTPAVQKPTHAQPPLVREITPEDLQQSSAVQKPADAQHSDSSIKRESAKLRKEIPGNHLESQQAEEAHRKAAIEKIQKRVAQRSQAQQQRNASPDLTAPSPEPEKHASSALFRKLPNGTIIRSSSLDGRGQLTIKNGLSLDAAAKLIDKENNMCWAYFYISSGSQFTLTQVPDGNYRLLFGVGEDWDLTTLFFTRSEAFSEFDKPMDFVTSQEQRGDYIHEEWTVIEVTLHPVAGGNIKTHTISATEFQKY